jgi:hypothetical protein
MRIVYIAWTNKLCIQTFGENFLEQGQLQSSTANASVILTLMTEYSEAIEQTELSWTVPNGKPQC